MFDREPNKEHRQEEMVPKMTDVDKEAKEAVTFEAVPLLPPSEITSMAMIYGWVDLFINSTWIALPVSRHNIT